MTQKDTLMKRYAIEVVNVDEELAEKAVRESVAALAKVCSQIKSKSLKVEPHDDTRGVYCGIDVDDSEHQSPVFVRAILDSFKSVVALSVYPAKPQIYIHTTGEKYIQ